MGLRALFVAALVVTAGASKAQDTFSIVAADTITGEVGSAGASCVDLFSAGITDIGFLGDLFPGIGAINTQAAYHPTNQGNARIRMEAGDTPAEIIAWLQANDAQGVPDANNRQYGIVRLVGSGSEAAAHTGSMCLDYAGHRVGANYSIQGNILLGPEILDSMEARFLNTPGTLAQKLMAALQGANVVGADTRCADNNSSSLFAFLKVSAPGDPDGDPYISLGVRTHDLAGIEPIDSLQIIFDNTLSVGERTLTQPVLAFPDPASVEVTIDMPMGVSSKGELRLFDAAGRRVSAPITTVHRRLQVNVAALSAGPYQAIWMVDGVPGFEARFIKQ